MTVLGTRPEIIRLSRIIPKLDQIVEHTLVHTGQNFTDNLSEVFFRDLALRAPNHFLGVDTSSFGRQLATLYESFEKVLNEVKPERVLILGDTNSALVAFTCARRRIPVFHMEAGNRCFDDRVPEEVNRRVIDHCSTVLMPYTQRSAENLVREGIGRERIFITGNPILEVLNFYKEKIDQCQVMSRLNVEPGKFLVATMHRQENVDNPLVFEELCQALTDVAELYKMPLILSVHPRIKEKLSGKDFKSSRLVFVDAMPFFDFVNLEKNARLLLSDSGTVQEECSLFRIPNITIRDTTERPETVECGSNIVTSTRGTAIVEAARYLRDFENTASWNAPAEYLETNVSDKVLRILLSNVERFFR